MRAIVASHQRLGLKKKDLMILATITVNSNGSEAEIASPELAAILGPAKLSISVRVTKKVVSNSDALIQLLAAVPVAGSGTGQMLAFK